MQILSAKPLIEEFRSGDFWESDVEPYFMAYIILTALVMGFAFSDANPWGIAAGAASVVITVFGALHLKRQNGDTFGNQFLAKYFALGWVITVRMILLSIPAAVVLFAFASIVGGVSATDPMGAIFTIAIHILFYWWLGLLYAEAQNPQAENEPSA